MISDIGDIDNAKTIYTDICIVGAGPAGITISIELASSGLGVLMLDSGGMQPSDAAQDLCRGDIADGVSHPPADRFRRRCLGGSSSIWGGRCVPFDPLDFEGRGADEPSGWPIGYREMAPWYPRACTLAEVGASEFRASETVPGGMRAMFKGFYHDTVSTETIERFSPPTHFGRKYRRILEMSRRIQVILGATCTDIALDPMGPAVKRITVRGFDGRTIFVQARAFVLAAGGLEVARLLLASRQVSSRGIGNDHGLVGRYYMCHIAGITGRFRPSLARPSPWHGYEVTWDGVYCRRRLSIEPATQRRLNIGNVIARLHHPDMGDPSHRSGALSAAYLGRRWISYEYRQRLGGTNATTGWHHHIANIARDPFRTAQVLGGWTFGRCCRSRRYPSLVVPPAATGFTLDVHAEQQPNAFSRVSLGDEVDAFGVPRLRIDWRYSEKDIQSVFVTLGLIASALRGGGHGVLDYDEARVRSDMLRHGAYGGHHLGTARMSATPSGGVVDPNCRVHGIQNLYVAGGAVFPTSSQANPTLTIVALSCRLAAHLRSTLTGQAPLPGSSLVALPLKPRSLQLPA